MKDNKRHEQPLMITSVEDIAILERRGYKVTIDIDKGMLYYEKRIPRTAVNCTRESYNVQNYYNTCLSEGEDRYL